MHSCGVILKCSVNAVKKKKKKILKINIRLKVPLSLFNVTQSIFLFQCAGLDKLIDRLSES